MLQIEDVTGAAGGEGEGVQEHLRRGQIKEGIRGSAKRKGGKVKLSRVDGRPLGS